MAQLFEHIPASIHSRIIVLAKSVLARPLRLGPSYQKVWPGFLVAVADTVLWQSCTSWKMRTRISAGDIFLASSFGKQVDAFQMPPVHGGGAVESKLVRAATTADFAWNLALVVTEIGKSNPCSQLLRRRRSLRTSTLSSPCVSSANMHCQPSCAVSCSPLSFVGFDTNHRRALAALLASPVPWPELSWRKSCAHAPASELVGFFDPQHSWSCLAAALHLLLAIPAITSKQLRVILLFARCACCVPRANRYAPRACSVLLCPLPSARTAHCGVRAGP